MTQNEVWLVNLDPTIGSEIQKKRPAIIVNDNALGKLPLKIIVPITDWKESYARAPWMVKIQPDTINGLSKESAADCFQIRSVSEERLIKHLGAVEEGTMISIKRALKIVLSIE